jgi:hypothetical protein
MFDLVIVGPSGSLFFFVPDYRKIAKVQGIAYLRKEVKRRFLFRHFTNRQADEIFYLDSSVIITGKKERKINETNKQ